MSDSTTIYDSVSPQFNAIEGEDDLGEVLFSDHETFKSRIAYLDPATAEEYA